MLAVSRLTRIGTFTSEWGALIEQRYSSASRRKGSLTLVCMFLKFVEMITAHETVQAALVNRMGHEPEMHLLACCCMTVSVMQGFMML